LHIEVPSVYIDGSFAWQYIHNRQANRQAFLAEQKPCFRVELDVVIKNFVSSTKIMLSLSFHLVKAILKGLCGVGELVLATAMETITIFLQLLIVAVSHSPVQFECPKCAF